MLLTNLGVFAILRPMTLTKYRIECRVRRVRLEHRRLVTPCGNTSDLFLSVRPKRCPVCQNSYVRVQSLRETMESESPVGVTVDLMDALKASIARSR